MFPDPRGKGVDLGYEGVLRLEEDGDGEHCESVSTMCLIGKVLTNKSFNVFGLLEAMRKAMNPSRGLTTNEIGKNLFSFQFKSAADMSGILNRQPWHFDKNIILLKELDNGEQPSTIVFTTVTFWVRLYDLPMSAGNPISIKKIGGCIGNVVEIDQASLDGIAHSIRIKVKIDYSKPLRRGILL
ncbi:hypothetical protein ACS0TY_014484 [Phlomoides rotata]